MQLVDEFAVSFFAELDYKQEASNAEYFAFTVRHLDQVLVPKAYASLTTRKVLTMDWVEGTHITQCTGVEMEEMVREGIRCYLTQVTQMCTR